MKQNEVYFSDLNYTMANEDTSLEVAMVRKLKPRRILSVCGSGGRSLPLLCAGPELLVNADLAPQQLYLAELREALYKSVSLESYLRFWSCPPYESTLAEERKKIFESLQLSSAAQSHLKESFEKNRWESLLYLGKWERTFAKISQLVAKILGPARNKIFEFKNLEEQKDYFLNKFPKLRWTAILLFVGNASFFNRLLYKGNFVKKNIPMTHYAFYRQAYKNVFTRGLARNNFFAQMSMLGFVKYAEGVPVEADPQLYSEVQDSLKKASVQYLNENIVSYSASGKERFDFFSYSDVPSYFEGEIERNFMQIARASLNPGAHVVLRHYLRIPENMDLQGFEDVTSDWKSIIDTEKTQMYVVQILRFKESAPT